MSDVVRLPAKSHGLNIFRRIRFRRSISPLLYDHLNLQHGAHGFVPAYGVPATDVMGVLARIGAGQGATCIPTPLAVRRYTGVVRRPLRARVTMNVAVVFSVGLREELREATSEGAHTLVRRGRTYRRTVQPTLLES